MSTTRRSFLSTLAVSLALCRFRLPPAEASLGTAPPMESLIVKGMKFTHDSQLWKYLRYKRLTFMNCEFTGVFVKGRLWSFEHCRFTESTVHVDYLGETDNTHKEVVIDSCFFDTSSPRFGHTVEIGPNRGDKAGRCQSEIRVTGNTFFDKSFTMESLNPWRCYQRSNLAIEPTGWAVSSTESKWLSLKDDKGSPKGWMTSSVLW